MLSSDLIGNVLGRSVVKDRQKETVQKGLPKGTRSTRKAAPGTVIRS